MTIRIVWNFRLCIMVRNITVSDRLARNIEMMRNDNEFLLMEKANVADALYGILSAKSELEDDAISENLETALEIVLSYMFYLELFKDE